MEKKKKKKSYMIITPGYEKTIQNICHKNTLFKFNFHKNIYVITITTANNW